MCPGQCIFKLVHTNILQSDNLFFYGRLCALCWFLLKVKVKVWVYSLVSSRNLSPDFTLTPLIIGNGQTLTYMSFFSRGSQQGRTVRSHFLFPLSYPLLLVGQRHLWRSDFSEDCRSPMKSLKLAQCRDLNSWSSDHKDDALANCTTSYSCVSKNKKKEKNDLQNLSKF